MLVSRRTLLAGGAARVALAQRGTGGSKPNIVLVLAEDLGAWLLGCYGNKEIRTPGLDLLARSGSRFASHSVATLGAAASRATLLTGRLARQHRIEEAAGPAAKLGDEVLISELLATGGYECAYAGRWDLGEDGKAQHGFRLWATQGRSVEAITGSAVEFLEARKPEQPFFLVVSYPSPRAPYDGLPGKYYDLYAKTTFDTLGWLPVAANARQDRDLMKDPVGALKRCAAAITALDDQILPLVSVVDKKGIRDNTLLIFTALNGLLAGRHGFWSGGRGSEPVNLYAEAVETPMIWNWPGKVPIEGVRSELAGSYDLFPTLCAVAGLTPPKDRNLCGRSYLLPITNQPLPRREPWRNLAFASYAGTEMARDSRFKLVLRASGAGPNELYDLRADPREFTNQFENAQFVTVRNSLTDSLRAWREKYV